MKHQDDVQHHTRARGNAGMAKLSMKNSNIFRACQDQSYYEENICTSSNTSWLNSFCGDLDEMWFDTWEGQVELSSNCGLLTTTVPLTNATASRPSQKQKFGRFRRQTSLPLLCHDDFQRRHVLYWNNDEIQEAEETDNNINTYDVKKMQQKGSHFSERQVVSNDKYCKLKQENTLLKNRLQNVETEYAACSKEVTSYRSQVHLMKIEKIKLEQELLETQQKFQSVKQECSQLHDLCRQVQVAQAEHQKSACAQIANESTKEIKIGLMEEQQANTQLRGYLDRILTNIMENYPQLLEVKK